MQAQLTATGEIGRGTAKSVTLDTAYHEAGHIALALHGCYVPFAATIIPTAAARGSMFHRPGTGDLNDVLTWRKFAWGGLSLRAQTVLIFGGAAVDQRRGRRDVGWDSDIAHARLALRALYGDAKRANDELPGVFAEAQAIVARPEVWRAIELIAGELHRRRELRGRHMLRLVLKAAPIIRGWDHAREEMRLWRGYPELAESAGGDPLCPVSTADFLPVALWPIGGVIAVLLMHAIWGR